MRRGTTPDYILTVAGYDLTECSVFVTLAQKGEKLTLNNDRLDISYENDVSTITFRLTQEETLSLKNGSADVQVRFIDANGEARATNIGLISVFPVLLEEVISYE